MATIVDGKKRIPFLRGMLAHYLIEHGFAFQDAYNVADRVRRSLQKTKEISAQDIAELVRVQVKKQFGDRAIGDGTFWEPQSRQIFVEEGQNRILFSLEHLADSLTATGLDHDLAHRIARLSRQELLLSKKLVVKRSDLFKTTRKVVAGECGSEYADRYDALYRFRHDQGHRPVVVLIGGASGVGKTSVGVVLANLLRISRVISTDAIRQIMRLMISRDLMPALHASSYEAWKLTGTALNGQDDRVVHAFREQAMRVGVGVRAMIARAIEEHASIIIDGVHLLPDLVDLKDYEKQAILIWVNLIIDDEKTYEDRFKRRGEEANQRGAHRYIQNLDSILKIQRHILVIGEAHKIPAVENNSFEETIQAVSQHIMDELREAHKK